MRGMKGMKGCPTSKLKKNWKNKRGSDTFSNLFNLRNTFLPFRNHVSFTCWKVYKSWMWFEKFQNCFKNLRSFQRKVSRLRVSVFRFQFFDFSFIVLLKNEKKNYPTPNQPTHNTKPPNHPTTRPGHPTPPTKHTTHNHPTHRPTQSFFFRVLSFSLNFFVFFFFSFS